VTACSEVVVITTDSVVASEDQRKAESGFPYVRGLLRAVVPSDTTQVCFVWAYNTLWWLLLMLARGRQHNHDQPAS
jgi:hypothetical protein